MSKKLGVKSGGVKPPSRKNKRPPGAAEFKNRTMLIAREGKTLRRSKSEIYLHFVWATYQRLPLITESVEQIVYGCILKEAHKHGCEVLTLGGVADHVHLLLKMPSKHSPSFLMQRIKGGSSTFARDRLASSGDFFGWQDGYGVFSVSRTHKKWVAEYVQNQKQHHADKTIQPDWEETDELAD